MCTESCTANAQIWPKHIAESESIAHHEWRTTRMGQLVKENDCYRDSSMLPKVVAGNWVERRLKLGRTWV